MICFSEVKKIKATLALNVNERNNLLSVILKQRRLNFVENDYISFVLYNNEAANVLTTGFKIK